MTAEREYMERTQAQVIALTVALHQLAKKLPPVAEALKGLTDQQEALNDYLQSKALTDEQIAEIGRVLATLTVDPSQPSPS